MSDGLPIILGLTLVVTLINTSHPGLCRRLRAHDQWMQTSCLLYGGARKQVGLKGGMAGHLRAVQGFRYIE